MRTWTDDQLNVLRGLYPETDTAQLAKTLGKTIKSLYGKAKELGLKKSEAYFKTFVAGRLTGKNNPGEKYRFTKGRVPANKGKKMPPEVYEKLRDTMFKPGQLPHNTKHFGKPYLNVTIEKGHTSKTWYIQIDKKRFTYLTYLCKQAGIDMTGKKPRLKDDYDFSRVPTLDDITVITNKENMLLNTSSRFPEDLRLLIHAKGVLIRQINKQHEKQRDNISRCEAASL